MVFLHKMPRIWLDYVDFLMKQRKITLTRRTLDRSLRALPITQHGMIWETYRALTSDSVILLRLFVATPPRIPRQFFPDLSISFRFFRRLLFFVFPVGSVESDGIDGSHGSHGCIGSGGSYGSSEAWNPSVRWHRIRSHRSVAPPPF